MKEAIVLGSGTSSGVPVLGVSYPDAFLSNPKNHRTRPSLLLSSPEGNILIDAGPDVRLQLLRERVRTLDAVVITHTHADHVMGLDDLRAYCLLTGNPLPIFTGLSYQEDIKRIFPYAFRPGPPGVEVPRFELQDVRETIEIGCWKLRCFWVLHGATKVLAIRVNGLAYLTDVNHIPEEAFPLLENLDVLIMDAVRIRRHPNHFHLQAAIEAALKIGAHQTFFTHLSHDFDHDAHNAKLPPGIALAYDGLRIPL